MHHKCVNEFVLRLVLTTILATTLYHPNVLYE